MDHLFQRREILLDGLIHEDVPVGQVENLMFHAALEQPVDNLEGRVSLAGARSHHQQDAVLAPRNSVQRAVDGDALVVAGRIDVHAAVIGLADHGLLGVIEATARVRAALVAGDQFLRGRKFIQGKLTLLAGEEVMLAKTVAVGTVGKGYIQHLRVFHSLLQAVGDAVAVVLCLYNGDGIVGVDIEDVVCPLGLFPRHQVAAQVDAPVGDLRLHGDAIQAPLCCDGRGDVMQLDVFLGHLPLRLNRAHVITPEESPIL